MLIVSSSTRTTSIMLTWAVKTRLMKIKNKKKDRRAIKLHDMMENVGFSPSVILILLFFALLKHYYYNFSLKVYNCSNNLYGWRVLLLLLLLPLYCLEEDPFLLTAWRPLCIAVAPKRRRKWDGFVCTQLIWKITCWKIGK